MGGVCAVAKAVVIAELDQQLLPCLWLHLLDLNIAQSSGIFFCISLVVM